MLVISNLIPNLRHDNDMTFFLRPESEVNHPRNELVGRPRGQQALISPVTTVSKRQVL